jgi:beta-xylosidase
VAGPATGTTGTAGSVSADRLGAAAGDAALGLRIPYYEPPNSPDPSAPGTTIISGADQPDPFMIVDGGRHYLFTSQDMVPANVPVRSGTTVGQWGPMTDALPELPPWAETGNTWAPDVHRFGKHYILYFTAEVKDQGTQIECIGNAISTKVDGPYLAAAAPLICQLGQGGSIDPRTFIDAGGQPYLLWKSDENSNVGGTAPTNIYSQPLSADGEHLVGQPSRMFGPDEPWQGRIVEAPDMVLVRGVYYLFYSGGWFNQPSYAIGVARCAGPVGPCIDTSPEPLMSSNAQGAGPGEESVFSDAAGVWLLYTPFRSTLPLPGPPRPVAMTHLGFGPSGPYVAAPQSVSRSG